MSIEVTNAVWKRSRQKSGLLLVLLALADYTNKEGVAWPAMSTLARKVRMSKRNAQRCVHALEQAGELEVRRNQGSRGSNIYRIRLSEIKLPTAAHVIGDGRVAKAVSSTSPKDDTSVTQSVIKPLRESTPIVPKGDDLDFWVKVCLECFEQPYRTLPERVLYRLAQYIPSLERRNADSLRKFYRYEELNSKEPPYTSRRHSPERLILDLPRQLALAVQEYPPAPPPKPPPESLFTIEEVWQYLREKYGRCNLPPTLEQLDTPRWDHIRPEILEAMRMKKKKQVP